MKLAGLLNTSDFIFRIIVDKTAYDQHELVIYANYDDTALSIWYTGNKSYEIACVIRNEDITPEGISSIQVIGITPGGDNDEDLMKEYITTGKVMGSDDDDVTEDLISEYHTDVPVLIEFFKLVPAATDEVAAEFLMRRL